MTLAMLLAASIAVGAALGILARMPTAQILAQCAAMAGAAMLFYGLVVLL